MLQSNNYFECHLVQKGMQTFSKLFLYNVIFAKLALQKYQQFYIYPGNSPTCYFTYFLKTISVNMRNPAGENPVKPSKKLPRTNFIQCYQCCYKNLKCIDKIY